MRRRIGALLLVFALCLGVLPAHAEVEVVDPLADPDVLLNEDEFLKMAQLQDTPIPFLGSEVSPDDTTVLVNNYRYSDTGSALLNVVDGSVVPIQPLQLGEDDNFFPLMATELVWFDNDTLGQLIFDLFTGVNLLTVDRYTGQLALTPLGQFFLPVSISPNGKKVLIAEVPDLDAEGMKAMLQQRLPFGTKLPGIQYRSADLQKPVRSAFQAHTDQKWAMNDDFVTLTVLDLEYGVVTPLVDVYDDSILIDYAWSPDGSKIAIIRDTNEYANQSTVRLVDGSMLDALGEWSPQDNPFFVNNVVDVFDVGTGELHPQAIRAMDGNGDIALDVDWSTDGERFVVQMFHPAQIKGRRYPSYRFPDRAYLKFFDKHGNYLSTFAAPEISASDLTVMPHFVSPDELMIAAPVGTTYKVFYYNQGSGEFRQVSAWDGTYFNFVSTRQSRQLIYSFSSFMNAPDIYRIQWDGQALARLTWSNAEPESLNAVRVDPVAFTLRSGAVRSGYLIQPSGAEFPPKNSPIIVWQEGGPRATFANRWATNVENPYNLLPNFGMPVLFVPLPGRLGFGPEFLNAMADGSNFGQIDIDEMAEIVDQLVQKGWTSEGKVGITGCSYGGYFTTQSITRHQMRYAAANSQCTLFNNSDEWHFGLGPLIAFLEGVKPTDRPDEYAADSPMSRASAVRTPTLLFHGTQDFLPIKFAVDFHDQIAIQGYKARLIAFDGEGHGLAMPTSQLRAGQEQLMWFRTYLNGDVSMASRQAESVVIVPAAETAPVEAAPVYAAPASAPQFLFIPDGKFVLQAF